MPGIVAVTFGISILKGLLLRLMDSILLKLKQNSAERKLIIVVFLVIIVCYCIRFAGSLVVYCLKTQILEVYQSHIGLYILFATCYWILVEFTPICFLLFVHYRNFSAQIQLDNPDPLNDMSGDIASSEIDVLEYSYSQSVSPSHRNSSPSN